MIVNRIELIDDKGRALVKYGKFELSYQDNKKTLKIFQKWETDHHPDKDEYKRIDYLYKLKDYKDKLKELVSKQSVVKKLLRQSYWKTVNDPSPKSRFGDYPTNQRELQKMQSYNKDMINVYSWKIGIVNTELNKLKK